MEDDIAGNLERPSVLDETVAALYETALDLADLSDLTSLLNSIVERATRILDARQGGIYFYDHERRELELYAARGLNVPLGTRLKLGESLAGRVALSKKAIVIRDYRAWGGRSPQLEGYPITSVLGVPMLFAGDLIGVLMVNESAPVIREFSEQVTRLLSIFAAQAAGAVHSAQLFTKEQQRAAQLKLLYDAGLALNSVLEPKAQLEYLFKVAMETLNADRAEFQHFDPAVHKVTFELGLGYSSESLEEMHKMSIPVDEDRGLVGWVIKKRLPLNIPDLYADPRYIIIDPELRSGLLVPVIRDNQVLGVLSVFSKRKEAFSSEHERLLLLFANQAAVAMENARLLEETQRRLHQVQAQWKIDKAIAGSPDIYNVLNVFLEQTTSQLGMDAAIVLLLDKQTGMLQYAAGRGFYTAALQTTNLKVGDSHAGQAAQEQRLITIPDLWKTKTGFLRSPRFKSERFMAYYAVPLIAKEMVNGVLEIFHRAPHVPDQEWLDLLGALADQAAIAIDSVNLFNSLHEAHENLTLAYDATLEGWVRALDLRDKETEGHTKRVSKLCTLLAHAMGVGDDELVHMRRGALLHDIGKIGVPDNILHKPGPLTDQEWEIMHKHPLLANDLLAPISYLHKALEIPYCHHEKWDGSGYPRGLKGEQIPLSARIFTVIDVWDALNSDRPYRKAWPKEEARVYIQDQAGEHFDPQVVEVFLSLMDDDPHFILAGDEFQKLIRAESEFASLA